MLMVKFSESVSLHRADQTTKMIMTEESISANVLGRVEGKVEKNFHTWKGWLLKTGDFQFVNPPLGADILNFMTKTYCVFSK